MAHLEENLTAIELMARMDDSVMHLIEDALQNAPVHPPY
jgi:hypothetical protein